MEADIARTSEEIRQDQETIRQIRREKRLAMANKENDQNILNRKL